jgi:hypothetical protein
MRNLLALLGFALVTFLIVGWYLDWYHVAPKPSPTPGHQTWEADINKKKISDDVNKGIKAGEDEIHKLTDKDGKPVPPR